MRRHVLNPSPASQEHAYGATLGEEWLRPLVSSLVSEAEALNGSSGEVILLDLTGIETATASFLKATIIQLLRAGQRAASGELPVAAPSVPALPAWNIFPCVVGLADDVREELVEVLASQRLVCLEVLAWDQTTLQKARLHGTIERTHWDTLASLISAVSGMTASQLYEGHREEGINQTAWNNRLSELFRLRLVRRVRQGRHWLYSSIAREVIRG